MSRGIVILVLALLLFAFLPYQQVGAASATNGPPAVLVIQSVPPNLPADGKQYQSIVVSLQDVHGKPSLATAPIIINLFSSQPNVAAVNGTVTIQPGTDYFLSSVTTTNTPGTTVITATSTGFQSAFVTVTTVTPSGLASKLRVFAAPTTILSNPGETDGLIYVELQDDTGLPAKSATDVTVQLSSSDPLIVKPVLGNVTIPAGQIYATVNYLLPSTSTGQASIDAFATGFTSGNTAITVLTPIGQIPCCKVALKGLLEPVGQNIMTIPADGNTYTAVELVLQDSVGNPVRAPSGGLVVQLSSSKDTVINIPNTVFIPSGVEFVLIDARTSFLAGIANLTAFATGYIGSSTQVQTVIPAPSKLTVYVAPTPKVLTSLDQILLVVQLQDSVGNPARAKADTSILITSSNSSVVATSEFLTIFKGQDYVSTFVKASAVGSTTFTASSSGLTSSQTLLTAVPLPLNAFMAVGANIVTNTQAVTISLSVTLDGLPLSGANVAWMTNNGNLSTSASTTDTSGLATVQYKPSSVGFANVTARVTDPSIGASVSHVYLTVTQTPPPPQPSLAQQVLGYSYLLIIPVVIIAVYIFFRFRQRRAKRRAELEAAFQTVG